MLKFLLEKEFLQIRRNPFIPRMIVLMPLMMMLIFPWVGTMEVRNIKVCVVDCDRSELSRKISAEIASSTYFILKGVLSSHEEAMQMIEYGIADSYVEIPQGFEAALIRNDRPQLFIASNSVNGTKGGLSNQYLTSILSHYFAQMADPNAPKQPSIANVQIKNSFNPYLNYKAFMIPALMVMLIAIISGFLPALNIVTEKEKGTIEQINVSPIRKSLFILSKLIPCWIIGFVTLTVCFIIAATVYGLIPLGGVIPIYLSAAIFVLITSGLGLVVSNYSDTMQQAMFVMFFFLILFILMSGLFTPISSMPVWAQELTRLNPLTYFIQIIRGVYLKGSTLADIALQLGILSLFALTAGTWAVISYRKKN